MSMNKASVKDESCEYSSLLLTAGKPFPLGANLTEDGVNFSIFSAHATKVVLCLFDPQNHIEVAQYILDQKTHHIWHGELIGAKAGLLYGYRVFGPYQPELGHRFNHHKLLLDPYAKKLVGELHQNKALYAYDVDDELGDLSFSTTDNAAFIPKCEVVDVEQIKSIPIKPINRDLSKSIIYETHVKGFTKLHPDLAPNVKGTFAALANPAVVQYLSQLGVTALELLPVHAFFDEPFLAEKNLNNYWGYNSVGFFALQPHYLSSDDIGEFRSMVSTLHQAGIEVILDVVYNHTAEGNQLGPSYHFRGIDNLSYYRLMPNEPRFYINDTGCGNTLNINHPQVLMLVMDSLRYWVEVMGVDGFRFDLASCLGRETYGFDPASGFFDALMQDPILCQVKLIAEPWDIGPGGYQLGNYPVVFSEWNDKYRDAMRRFWRGDSAMLSEFAKRFHGSSDLFEHNGRGPSASINFITSHDGFSLHDLVTYKQKHNEANGEDNRDGHSENFSCHYGVEGETLDESINQIRNRQKRNFIATLMLSQGVPMLLSGDEAGHSQHGNNNAYCQDNPNSWFNWRKIDWQLVKFTRELISLRKQYPLLCHKAFIHKPEALFDNGIAWFNRLGEPMTKALWSEHLCKTLSVIVTGNLLEDEVGAVPENTQALLIFINADSIEQAFNLPKLPHFAHWSCVIHSQTHSAISPSDSAVQAEQKFYLQPRSLMIFHSHFQGVEHV
ncbi:glycogen debranching protein GlgX [Shewanella gaetbuli]